MFSRKKRKDSEGGVYLASHSSDEDFSSGMSGGFSANSKEEYEAAKVNQPDSLTLNPLTLKAPAPSDIEGVNSHVNVNSNEILTQFKRLDQKVDSVVIWIKSFYSNFAKVIERVNFISENLSKNEERISQVKATNELKEKDFSEILKDVEDLKKRAEVFISTEEMLKLHDEIKRNLDKIMQHSSGYKNKEDNIPIDLLEKTAILAKQNKEAIGKFTFEDYQEKVDSILKVVENLADQVSELREKAGFNEDQYNDFKSTNKKNIHKKEGRTKESNKDNSSNDLEEIPELPELIPQKIKKTKKRKVK